MIDSRPRLYDSTLTGISIADTMSILDDRLLLTLGLRHQGIGAHNYTSNVGTLASSYDKSALSPMVGLVVRPWENVSIYGNYIEGLSRGEVAPAAAGNSGEVLAPYVAHQVEAGLKVNWWGTLGTTFSAFQITRRSANSARNAASHRPASSRSEDWSSASTARSHLKPASWAVSRFSMAS